MGKCSWRQKGTKAKILEEKTKTSQEGVLPKKKKVTLFLLGFPIGQKNAKLFK